MRELNFSPIEPLLGPIADLKLSGIDWVIVGGESGPGARPIQRNWVVDIRRQCRQAGVAFFFKQWGGVNKRKPAASWTVARMTKCLSIKTMRTSNNHCL